MASPGSFVVRSDGTSMYTCRVWGSVGARSSGACFEGRSAAFIHRPEPPSDAAAVIAALPANAEPKGAPGKHRRDVACRECRGLAPCHRPEQLEQEHRGNAAVDDETGIALMLHRVRQVVVNAMR